MHTCKVGMRSPFGNVKASADTRTPTQNKIFGKYQVLGFLGFSLFTKGHVIYFFGCGGANTQTQSGIYYIDDLTKPNPKTFN